MTKASIVQRLLDADLINAEEAVILLTNENHNGITYIPYVPNDVTNPYNPPFQPYCTTSTSDTPFEYSDTKWPSENHD